MCRVPVGRQEVTVEGADEVRLDVGDPFGMDESYLSALRGRHRAGTIPG